MSELERDRLTLVMFAAWVNLPPERIPPEMRAHTCAATAEAWSRVGRAATEYLAETLGLMYDQGESIDELLHNSELNEAIRTFRESTDRLSTNRGEQTC